MNYLTNSSKANCIKEEERVNFLVTMCLEHNKQRFLFIFYFFA